VLETTIEFELFKFGGSLFLKFASVAKLLNLTAKTFQGNLPHNSW